MPEPSRKTMIQKAKEILWNLGLITFGCFVCSVAINGILVPHKFYGGGFTGIALVAHYLMPSVSVGIVYFLINIPVYALGWMYVGRRFFLYSIAGMFIFSGSLEVIQVTLPVYDKILSALLAGIITGFGSGIILRSLGSAGGLDILSVIFLKRYSIRLGSTFVAFNAVILVAGAYLFSLESALYTLIYIYISSQMVNLVVSGLSQRKAVYIISNAWKRIAKEIMRQINRGVTVIHGEGGFTGREVKLLYTVITFRELARVKKIIRGIDPDAVVVVSDTLEVMGQRIGNQPHW